MRIVKKEFGRVVACPFLAFVFLTFLLFNCFIIHKYVEIDEPELSWGRMHQAVLDCGVELDGQRKHCIGETGEYYQSYVDTYRDMYDELDMQSILCDKKAMTKYEPKGAFADFIDKNYQTLQRRVEEIVKNGEGEYGFYPGRFYSVHGMMYGKIGKKLLLEMLILEVLCVLMLMDYERVHGTREIVAATKTGKNIMKLKAGVGVLCGIFYSVLLLAGTYLYFFLHVSLKGLLDIPVSSAIMAEERNMLMYPFVTFWRVTEKQYFILFIAVMFMLLLLAAAFTAALQMFLQNSYLAFLLQCVCCMGGYWLLFQEKTGTFLDLFSTLVNPVSLWVTCGAWFMENDIILSFAGNEFWCIGCSGVIMIVLLATGWRRYRRLEL